MTEHELSPLFERIACPETMPTLAHPDVETWRPVGDHDLDLIVVLEAAMAAADHPEYALPRAELADDLGMSFVDRERDSIVALDADGRAVAWGLVHHPPGHDTLVRSILVGGVHPEWRRRGIGRVLLAWQRARGEQQLAASDLPLPGWIMGFTDDRARGAGPLLESEGFTAARYFAGLRRDLGEPVDDVRAGAGIRVEALQATRADEVRTARNDAFRDHWGSQPRSEEEWRVFLSSAVFRMDLSVVAIDEASDRVVGFVLGEVNEDDWDGQGFSSVHVPLVGVVRGHRGRGVAKALLAAHLIAAGDAGLEYSTLEVDAANPTGAFALYEAMGFRAATTETSYTIVV
ncbi:GNAT family N-acetyltransferase [Agromyces cerinus]|uniref:Ribosomal protein S18 acetylase RimI n=1 Tax=Agromyces cerinus subsp. cerinus TaxID=232089 RepID=A0A1N6FF34_9MICO|nr:GNAT family N-acetyltransferase [Agromyces cerinus]SIN93869.1 Ribosomal protein S18 acetylase RimI [Agromyces cerinus subsp. cerinus]